MKDLFYKFYDFEIFYNVKEDYFCNFLQFLTIFVRNYLDKNNYMNETISSIIETEDYECNTTLRQPFKLAVRNICSRQRGREVYKDS
jgi:hypothetical protein